jgi:hypothetical protein
MTTRCWLYTSLIASALCTAAILPAAADDVVPLPTPKPTMTVAKRTAPRHVFHTARFATPMRVAYVAPSVPIVIGIAF